MIIADKNKEQLQKLITLIDDSRNDIYLLIDKSSNIIDSKFHVDYSSLNYLKPINIYWGSYSIIQAELNLFKASNSGHYGYYHLISGQDLPLVNQDVIHNFFDKYKGYEFIQYQVEKKLNINDKLNYHFFTHSFDSGIHSDRSSRNFLFKVLWSVYRKLETIINISIPEHRIPINKVSAASQWVSIDDNLVQVIVKSSKWIYSKFHRGKVVDELFIPTLLNYYPNILKRVYDTKRYKKTPARPMSNLRYIRKRVNSSHPNVWTVHDLRELNSAKDSGYIFSRKFDSQIDDDVINKIFDRIMDC